MDIGRTLIVVGAIVLAIGLAVTLVGRVPLVGRLPGDVSLQGDGWTLYAPIATSIVLSIVLTLALNAFAWLARR
jgi:hypothetical protein